MPSRVSTVLLLAVIQLTMVAASPIQAASDGPPTARERPRIGLCLAGGGARGGAHIGVLQVLEEMRVPVDYIAGTSIGSIIGGLYATGMSPDEMDTTVAAIDWVHLFNDSPPRQLQNFRRKEEDRLPYLGIEVGLGRGGLKMPAGFVAGPKLLFLLRRLTLPVATIDDFDELPIPFRAVATDLDSGEPFVVGHGTVADAVRASMAIPGAFTPHVIDGRTLVDGGVLRNVPYDVVKAMGADIVIIVDISRYPTEFEGDPSLAGVLKQTVTVAIAANARASVAQATDADLLLVPDLDGFSVEGFDRMGETVARGRAVAETQREWLRRLSLSEADYQAWRASVASKRRTDEIIVGDVWAESPGRVDPRRVRMKVHSRPDAPLDLHVLGDDISRVIRLGEFEFVDYTLVPRDDSAKKDLVVEATDKRWGPNYLRFGLALEGHANGQTLFTFLIYHRRASINKLGAEWRNQLSLGTPLALDTEFYQPITMNGRFFVAPRLTGGVDERRRYIADDLTSVIESEQWMGRLDLGLNMSHWGELRLGAFHGYYSGATENNVVQLDEHRGGWRGRLVFDQLDDPHFPRHGWGVQLDGRLSRAGLGADTEYDLLSARIDGAVTTGRTTFLGRLGGGTSFGTKLPFYDRFELGGFTRLSGLDTGQLFGDEMAMATLGVQYRIATLHQASGGNVYLGVLGETGQTWLESESPAFSDLLVGFAGYVGVETLLGPFYTSYGYTEGGFQKLSIYLGRTF